MHFASEDGIYSFKKTEPSSIDTDAVCGLYMITDPDQIVEITIKYINVDCNDGGLMSVWNSKLIAYKTYIKKTFIYLYLFPVCRRLGTKR